jgi:hypothetical protein
MGSLKWLRGYFNADPRPELDNASGGSYGSNLGSPSMGDFFCLNNLDDQGDIKWKIL